MDKQEFIKLMTELVSIKKAEDNLNTAIRNFEPDFSFLCFGRYETLVVRSLELAMNDKFNWISYWLYECDMGRRDKNVTDKKGQNIPIKTLSNLYNVITKIEN